MKKISTLKRLLVLNLFALALAIVPSKAIWAQCNAGTAMAFIDCLTGTPGPPPTPPATSIVLTADVSVDLSNRSLAGVSIDLNNKDLSISGDPITVSSSTTFSSNGNAGKLFAYGYTFSNSQGSQFPFSTLNNAMDLPANNTLEKAVLYAAGILPVTLSSFNGALKPASEQVQLEWTTSAELNNERFIIETSTEGEVFNRIGEIAGAGTTTEAHTYQFTHQTPSAGVNYYRLKQVDFDGTFAYSKVIAVNAGGNDKIFAFPNPVQDQLNIQYDQSKGSAALFLFDAMGRKINTTVGGYPGYYEAKLPTDLPAGTYWLRVIRSGKVQTLPIIKQ